MQLRWSRRLAVTACLAGALGMAGTLAGTSVASAQSGARARHFLDNPWGWPGNPRIGYLPPHEPDVNRDGKVVIGLITAGDITDHGYYESEVEQIDAYVKKYHWHKPIIQSLVNPGQALQAAVNMCRQHIDLLVIGESELAAAGPAASSSACRRIPVWVYASAGTMQPSPYYYMAQDLEDPQSFVTGYAMGLWLKAHHQTTAGYIAGPALSFTERPARGYYAGMRAALPSAKLLTAYTGDFNASGPAITAVQAMLAKGVKLIFPYLGGALFPAARYAAAHGAALMSDGGALCNMKNPRFAISQVYWPGYYLKVALAQFAQGKFRVGIVHNFKLGVSKVPTVYFCQPSGIMSNKTLDALMKRIAQGKLDPTAIINATPQP
ncbi:MAG TPA: BMP family ABC transporter substrate-binding protein [Acidimicrobiales bacterium]|nr:BMP family ABC transporter substrate-binding protein [Acidimicrobiales bacterium]